VGRSISNSATVTDHRYNKWLNRFAWFTAVATLFLICSGGMVTSKGVGLAVPDWPTTFGYNMFLFPVSKWIGGVLFEHTHRLIASTVGFLTIILAIWLWRTEDRQSVKTLGLIAVAGVILQGILGGLTVRMFQPPAVSAAHATLVGDTSGNGTPAVRHSNHSGLPRSGPRGIRVLAPLQYTNAGALAVEVRIAAGINRAIDGAPAAAGDPKQRHPERMTRSHEYESTTKARHNSSHWSDKWNSVDSRRIPLRGPPSEPGGAVQLIASLIARNKPRR